MWAVDRDPEAEIADVLKREAGPSITAEGAMQEGRGACSRWRGESESARP